MLLRPKSDLTICFLSRNPHSSDQATFFQLLASSANQFQWASAHCSLRLLFLATRVESYIVFSCCSRSAQGWMCCSFSDAFLLNTVVNSGYLSHCSLSVSSIKSGNFSVDLSHQEGASIHRPAALFPETLEILMFENSRSAVTEILKPALLTSLIMAQSYSLRSHFLPDSNFWCEHIVEAPDLNLQDSMRCTAIWLTDWIIAGVYVIQIKCLPYMCIYIYQGT